LSGIRVPEKDFFTRPLARIFFDLPNHTQDSKEKKDKDEIIIKERVPEKKGAGVLTLRLIYPTSTSTEEMTGIAITFDHALCDMSGAGLLMAHISNAYQGFTRALSPTLSLTLTLFGGLRGGIPLTGTVSDPPPPPHHARGKQALINRQPHHPIEVGSTDKEGMLNVRRAKFDGRNSNPNPNPDRMGGLLPL